MTWIIDHFELQRCQKERLEWNLLIQKEFVRKFEKIVRQEFGHFIVMKYLGFIFVDGIVVLRGHRVFQRGLKSLTQLSLSLKWNEVISMGLQKW